MLGTDAAECPGGGARSSAIRGLVLLRWPQALVSDGGRHTHVVDVGLGVQAGRIAGSYHGRVLYLLGGVDGAEALASLDGS